jgi:hypothetical protein
VGAEPGPVPSDRDGQPSSACVVEVLGAAGLILPPATGIAPVLAIAAAAGFAALQILAAGLHLSRRETSVTGLNAALIVLAAVAAWLATAF